MFTIEQRGISVQQAVAIKNQKDHFQTKLEKLRVSLNISQGKLAKLAGIPVRTIQCYEQRVRDIDSARLSTLLDLCIVLNCTLKDILENSDNINKLEQVLDIPSKTVSFVDTVEESSASENTYEKSLIEKYFYNEALSDLTEDQKAGIAFVSKDFPEQWKNILKLRYIDLLTLDDIAAQKGITRERVRQIALKAIKRLEEYESSEYVVSGLQTSQQKAEQEQNDRLLFDRSIDELNLSGRAHNCLMRAGYTTIGEVVLARKELIKIKNIGKHVVEEICDKIDLYTKDFISKG